MGVTKLIRVLKSPCNLYTSIKKQPNVTCSTGKQIPVVVEERWKIIWQPHTFMKSCQLEKFIDIVTK